MARQKYHYLIDANNLGSDLFNKYPLSHREDKALLDSLFEWVCKKENRQSKRVKNKPRISVTIFFDQGATNNFLDDFGFFEIIVAEGRKIADDNIKDYLMARRVSKKIQYFVVTNNKKDIITRDFKDVDTIQLSSVIEELNDAQRIMNSDGL